MSLDKSKFLAGLAVLAGAFGREVDGPVQRAYYTVLGSQLTDAEFERAVNLCLASETYWPSPAVILGKVKQGDTAAGLAALEHVGRVMGQHGGARFLPHAKYQEFDAPTKAAIAKCGGLLEIQNTSSERWPSLQKKFATAYTDALHPQPQLPAPSTDPQVKDLIGTTVRKLSLVSGRDRAAGPDA